MIIVKSLNTQVAKFASLADLIANFNPQFGQIQDFTYIDTADNSYISWYLILNARQRSYEMTENEELLAITNSLLEGGELEITIADSLVQSAELVEQCLMLVCENGNMYPAEIINLAELLG